MPSLQEVIRILLYGIKTVTAYLLNMPIITFPSMGVFIITNATKFELRILPPRRLHPFHQTGQFQQAASMQWRAARRQFHERVPL